MGCIFIFNLGNLFFADLNFYGYNFILDSSSFSLIILSFLISVLMYLARLKIVDFNENSLYFSFFILRLIIILFFTFTVCDYILFYFFFESSLIPTLMIIIG